MSEFNVEEFEVVDMGDAGVETKQGGPGARDDHSYANGGKYPG